MKKIGNQTKQDIGKGRILEKLGNHKKKKILKVGKKKNRKSKKQEIEKVGYQKKKEIRKKWELKMQEIGISVKSEKNRKSEEEGNPKWWKIRNRWKSVKVENLKKQEI